MELVMQGKLKVGEWTLHPDSGELTRGDEVTRLEARMVRLLLCLVAHANEVVSIDTLLSEVWQGVIVTPDSVYQAVTALRRILGDDPKNPSYIATVPRRGYRLIATVSPQATPAEQPTEAVDQPQTTAVVTSSPAHSGRVRFTLAGILAVLVIVGLVSIPLWRNVVEGHTVAAPSLPAPQTIAVMPFLDLTDEMTEEPFADGMVEEVIGKLSKFSTLKVAPPTSSFFYKDKKVALTEVAHTLNVRYVLDGSVRKSGPTLRVAARLTRADDGFVVWSETYDRSWSDKLMIQNDIAEQVAKALATTLH